MYKAAFTREESLRMICDGECGTFNPRLLECFLEIEPQVARLYEHTGCDSGCDSEGERR